MIWSVAWRGNKLEGQITTFDRESAFERDGGQAEVDGVVPTRMRLSRLFEERPRFLEIEPGRRCGMSDDRGRKSSRGAIEQGIAPRMVPIPMRVDDHKSSALPKLGLNACHDLPGRLRTDEGIDDDDKAFGHNRPRVDESEASKDSYARIESRYFAWRRGWSLLGEVSHQGNCIVPMG